MPGNRTKTSCQKDVKTYKGHKRRNRPPNPPEKIIPGAQLYKGPQRINKTRRKKSRGGHIPIKYKYKATGEATRGAGASQFTNQLLRKKKNYHGSKC